MQSLQYPAVEEEYDEKTLEAAHKRFRGRIGLQELWLECARMNGYGDYSWNRDPQKVQDFAFHPKLEATGFSLSDISGILSNVANKSILEGYNHVENTWRLIAKIASVRDFKTITRYRMIGNEEYEKIAPGGEIKHGDLGEQSYTNKADTYAKLLAVTRTDLINDDQG